jgi:hypothetical protein
MWTGWQPRGEKPPSSCTSSWYQVNTRNNNVEVLMRPQGAGAGATHVLAVNLDETSEETTTTTTSTTTQ